MTEKRWLYFALGVTTVISIGAVTNQLVPLAPATGVALSDTGITFPDGTVQTTAAAGNPYPPCFSATKRFKNCGYGAVTDTVTGLIWLENANCYGTREWTTANGFAAQLKDGVCGLTDGSQAGDWRLPTTKEWESILDNGCSVAPKIVGNGSPFDEGCYDDSTWASNVQPAQYWSSTTVTGNVETAGIAAFQTGNSSSSDKTDDRYVWPVRGGP